ncbi:SDR family oxidoreductase, partial [bacterium]|nr:SDR family oxidoreductase [bacterium]
MTKKLLITGVNGFIGSNCKKHFENTGYEVFGIDIAGEAKGNTLIGEVDIKNIKTFNQSFDYIFHFAGSSTVSMAQKAPDIEKIKAVGSTKEILEYIKNYNKDAKLIFSSSAAVYGNDYKRPIKEDDKLNPISIYGFHKLESENLCEYYSKNYGLDIKIVRIFSLYGTGLKKQLLWDFINRAIKAENVLGCFGTGDEKRDFVNIRDLINFLEILIKKE